MESELSASFREAVARWLRAKGLDAVTVTVWDEYLDRCNSGCARCGYGASENEVSIYYLDSNGRALRHVHYGLFSDLLTELLDA